MGQRDTKGGYPVSELLAVALLLGAVWLAAVGLLGLPLWVGAVGVAGFFIIALWLGNWLDATEYDGEGE